MTIKRNRENVILKNGKVSCSCCDIGCCMYSAQALADGLYGASDLPDAVTINGVSYSRSGTSYGNTTNGVRLEDGVWARYTNGARSERPCLIQGGVEDQFADTYTVSAGSGSSGGGTVTRISLCEWIGVDDCGYEIKLFYSPSQQEEAIASPWRVQRFFYGQDCNEPEGLAPDGDKKAEGEFQNTPVGNYDGLFPYSVS